ncbi:MAG: hypothetical protein ACM3QS_08145, partial [Bacteroidota bacterium]
GTLLLAQNRAGAAISAYQQSLHYVRQADDKRLLVTCLLSASIGSLVTRDLGTASARLLETLDLCREIGDQWSEVLASLWLSNVASLQGDAQTAAQLVDRTLVLARRQGDPWSLVIPLADMAQEAFSRGDLEKAESSLLEVEAPCRIVGDNWTLAWILNSRAQVELERLEWQAAEGHILEALQLSRQYGNLVASAMALVETAAMLTLRRPDASEPESRRSEDLGKAARLCGAVSFLAGNPAIFGGGMGAGKINDSMIARVRSAIAAEIWDPAFSEGQSLSLDQALDLAASELHTQTVGG